MVVQEDNGALRRRREDDVTTDIDSYVQDVITRLDRVILRLLEEAEAANRAAAKDDEAR